MANKKHTYTGYIEERELLWNRKRYFLIEVDDATKKVHATYGPFYDLIGLRECASIHGIKVEPES